MLNNIYIPSINAVKFYFQSDIFNTSAYTQVAYNSFNPIHNDREFDSDFFYRNLKSWLDKVKYFQPWQQSDKIVLQFWGVADYVTGPTIAYTVKIVNSLGETVKQVDSLQGAEIGTGSGIYIRSATLTLFDVPEGKYFVQIHKVGLFTDYDYFFISEPIEVKVYHKDTILMRYKHSENSYDVFWETGIEMWIRVPASFTKLIPESIFNVYENDEYDLTLLSGLKYRNWQLTIGTGNKPIPMYFLDMLEEITLCDSLYIGAKRYTRLDDSKLEPVPIEKHPLGTANLNLREKINGSALNVDTYPPIVLGNAPTAAWFYINGLKRTSPSTVYPIEKYFNGAINFVQYLNCIGFLGADFENTYFAIDTKNRIVLITNVEAIFLNYDANLTLFEVLEGHLIIDVETTATQKDLVVQYVNSIVSSKYQYFFGDGTNANGTGTGTTETHTYAANKKLTAYLFWDQAEEIYLDASQKIIKEIGGELPKRTRIFFCTDNTLKTLKNNIFVRMLAYPTGTNIQLWGNKLSQFAIDDIFRYVFDARKQFNTPASIDLQGQNPITSPSTELKLIKGRLANAGITMLTD